MPRSASRTTVLLLTLALAAGCKPTPVTPATKTPKPASTPRVAVTAGVPVNATLTGKVKLIADAKTGLVSDHGGGLIGDHGGGLVSDHGGGILSNNSGGILSNNGSAIVANNSGGYRLAQAAGSLATFGLAEAEVTFLDAAGQPLKGTDGKPLVATTDQAGAYALDATIPARNFVARVALKGGGELRALVVPGTGGKLTADLDTASTIGAAYVLDRLVKGDQAVYDRLPRTEADRLTQELTAFPGYLVAAPTYRAEAMAAAAEALAARVPTVDKVIEDVKALLLGQSQLGEGRLGTEVALSEPGALVALADGSLLIGEAFLGRVRQLAPDGTITTLVDPSVGKIKIAYPRLTDLARAADGTIYAGSKISGLYRSSPTGETVRILEGAESPEGLPAQPESLAVAPDGTLYVGEFNWTTGNRTARLLRMKPGQTTAEVLPIDAAWAGGRVSGLAVAPDGSVVLAYEGAQAASGVYRWRDGVATKLVGTGGNADLAVGPDGTIYLAQPKLDRVVALGADGSLTPVAGAGAPAGAGDLQGPSSLAVGPAGTLWIADSGRVWALTKAGGWSTVAGAGNQVEVGDTTAFAINQPAGVAFGPAGDLLIAEAGAGRVRRYADGGLTPFAGGAAGHGPDGGLATAVQLASPASLSFAPDGTLYLTELGSQKVRAVAPDGTISTTLRGNTIVGTRLDVGAPVAASAFKLPNVSGVAAGKGGQLFMVSAESAQLLKFTPGADGGSILALAGRHAPPSGDVFSPAGYVDKDEADPAGVLGFPLGVALDPAGVPHVAEFAAGRISRIETGPDGKTRLVRVAGRAMAEMVAEGTRVAGTGETTDPDDVAATATTLVFPTAVAFDGAGAMYVAEAGTIHIGALAAVSGGGGDAMGAFVKLAIGAYGMPTMAGRVRKIAADGTITTVAGRGSKFFASEQGDDALVLPLALAIAPDGRLAIADLGANMVRILPAGSY